MGSCSGETEVAFQACIETHCIGEKQDGDGDGDGYWCSFDNDNELCGDNDGGSGEGCDPYLAGAAGSDEHRRTHLSAHIQYAGNTYNT